MSALLVVALAAGSAQAEKRLSTARLASGLGTGGAVATMFAAFVVGEEEVGFNRPVLVAGLAASVVGPALGEIYTGSYVTPGMAVRLGGALLAVYAMYSQSTKVRCETDEITLCDGLEDGAYPLLGIAAIALIGGTAYDIRELPAYVDRANGVSITVTPTVLPTPTGSFAPGVSTLIHF